MSKKPSPPASKPANPPTVSKTVGMAKMAKLMNQKVQSSASNSKPKGR